MKRLMVLTLAATLPLACKPDDGKKDESAPAQTPVEQKTESVTDTATDTATDVKVGDLALDLNKPTEVIATMGAAMVSVAEAKNADGVNLNPGTIALATLALTGETCKTSGSPAVEGKTGGEYAAYAAYCDLAKHPDGPDTTLGGIDRVKGVLCAIEGQFAFDNADHEVTLSLDEKCFSKEFVEMAKSQNLSTIKQIVRAWDKHETNPAFGNAGFDKFIELKLAAGEEMGFVYNLQLSKKGDVFSVAIVTGMDEAPENPDYFAISLDTSAKGEIRYEGRFAQFKDENAPKSRHLRVLAKGAYDGAKKAFSSVDGLEYLFWDVNAAEAPSTDLGSRVMTVKGSPGTGYKALGFNVSPAFVVASFVPADDDAFCFAGDCAENAGLYPTKDEDFAFAKNTLSDDPGFYSGKKFFAEKGPLVYPSVTFAGEP